MPIARCSSAEGMPVSEIASRAVRGTLAIAASTLVGRVASFLGALYLMAKLQPSDFGVVAYAAALLSVCDAVANWGFAQGAIHRRERVEETFSTFLCLRLLGLVGVVALFAAGAIPFRTALLPRTDARVLLALVGALVVGAASDPPAARLARQMRFGRLALAEGLAAVVATAVGVGLAALGFGVWALVGNRVAEAAGRLVGLLAFGARMPIPRLHLADARWLLGFGLPLWLGSLATTWVLRYDDLVVGQLCGQATLGHYDRAYRLALLPLGLVTAVLTKVSFPLYARLRDDRRRLSEAFRMVASITFRGALLIALAMAVLLPDFLVAMGWRRWRPMVAMFRWLLPYAVLRPLMDDAGGLLTAVGRPRVTGHTLVAEALALLVLCPVLTWRWGARGAAASVGLVVLAGLGTWFARYLPRHVAVPAWRIFGWPLVATCVGVGAATAAGHLGLRPGWQAGAARVAAALLAFAATLLITEGRSTLGDLRSLLHHLRARDRDG